MPSREITATADRKKCVCLTWLVNMLVDSQRIRIIQRLEAKKQDVCMYIVCVLRWLYLDRVMQKFSISQTKHRESKCSQVFVFLHSKNNKHYTSGYYGLLSAKQANKWPPLFCLLFVNQPKLEGKNECKNVWKRG